MMDPLKYWKSETFEISSHSFNLSERINSTFKTSGSDNTEGCTYSYNELGFRGDSIKKEGFKIMSLGCSFTEGVGVNDDQTWPAQFTSKIKNGVNLNFGTGGRSNDFIARCLLSYYDDIRPDLVLVMYTYPQRREIYTGENKIEPYIPSVSWGYLKETEEGRKVHSMMNELQNNNQDAVDWYKNHQLIKYFLKSKNCNWLWNGWCTGYEYTDENRFDGDYKNFLDLGVDGNHPGPMTNKKYSEDLFNHLSSLRFLSDE